MKKVEAFFDAFRIACLFVMSLCVVSVVAASCDDAKHKENDYTSADAAMAAIFESLGFDSPKVFDSSIVTPDFLENRSPNETVIERCVGVVINDEYDGKVLNCYSGSKDYISYAAIAPDVQKGDTVLTYFVYNPASTYIDDILFRYDFVQNPRK